MLVYYKERNGIFHYAGYRVYGINAGPPCDLPKAIYEQLKNVLVYATYREGYFKEKFGVAIPQVAFTYPEIDYLNKTILDKILRAAGQRYNSIDTMKGALKCLLGQ